MIACTFWIGASTGASIPSNFLKWLMLLATSYVVIFICENFLSYILGWQLDIHKCWTSWISIDCCVWLHIRSLLFIWWSSLRQISQFWCFGTADVSHLIINSQNATSKSPVIISFPFVDSSSSYGMFDFIFFQNAKWSFSIMEFPFAASRWNPMPLNFTTRSVLDKEESQASYNHGSGVLWDF